MHGCIAISLHLTIVFPEIINFAPNNYSHFHPPLDEILATPLDMWAYGRHMMAVRNFFIRYYPIFIVKKIIKILLLKFKIREANLS